MQQKLWWSKSKRIIQYNLQEKDAALMDAVKIAQDTIDLGGNAICINAGGVVAWYPSKVPFHKINAHMPEGRDILKEILDACHDRDIKVYARLGWGMIEDEVYHQNPGWVTRKADGSPVSVGNDRPGLWNLIYSACPNGGYQNEKVMLPVVKEIVENYEIDGIFWCAGFAQACWCNVCKKKYFDKYGKRLPENASDFEPDWLRNCGNDNSMLIREAVRNEKPDMPFIRYYFPFKLNMGGGFKLPPDNIVENSKAGNMLCTEAQDILSLGKKSIPEWSTPALRMKMGRTIEGIAAPIGILHTCPGMDWRHVGMPASEYLYWSAQIMANGGQLWASLTGIYDTIPDKRVLGSLKQINQMIMKVEDDMDGAKSVAQVLLFSDDGTFVQGWADALISCHVEFDMMAHYQFDLTKIKKYPVAIIPKGFQYPEDSSAMLTEYVSNGGHLIIEGTDEIALEPVLHLLGIEGQMVTSEPLVATYMRIEEPASVLKQQIGESDLVPLRGTVGYCVPKTDTTVLTSWVPPFSSFQTSGNPPERSSLPASHTRVPICMVNQVGQGKVMFLAYEPSRLVQEFGMRDFYTMIGAYATTMLEDRNLIDIDAPRGVLTSIFQNDNALMVHFVNGIGERPLQEISPCHHLSLTLKMKPEWKIKSVSARISGQPLKYALSNAKLTVELPTLEVWEMILIEFDGG